MAAWGNRARRNPAHRLLGRKLAVRSHPAVDGVQGRLSELGYAPGQYVIDGRYADGDDELLPRLAADLVSDKPDVIFTVGPQAASAAAQATSKIPIIFVGVGDPVGTGLVPNLSRPPGNVTGITLLTVELAAKRLDL